MSISGSVDAAAREVVDACLRMADDGLVVGTAGNVSVRLDEGVLVTPSGVGYRELRPEQLPLVALDGTPLRGDLVPTSELPLHLAVYADRADARAIVHTHALHATAVSTLCDSVPAAHYMLATSGERVRVAGYATYGTAELAANAVAALRGSASCLLRNHGTISIGGDVAQAYDRASTLEWCCRLWLTARAAGTPALLPTAEVAAVAEKLRGYGQPGNPGSGTPGREETA